MPTPVDYSSQEPQRDVFTLDQSDPLFRQRLHEKTPPRNPAPTPPPPKPALKPQPVELPASFYEANSESYLRARRVAEMKFNTIKLLIAYVLASGAMVALNVFLYPGVWWCYWPIGFWAVVMAFPIIKCFLFRGRDIRSVIEMRLHKMALREVERFDTDL